MRGVRVVVGLFSAVAIALFASQGCQDPTQVTLEISLTERAKCEEVPHGTAVTVGVEPKDVEERVTSGFVNAKTRECDPVTRRIGTLVITPADPGRASVIVVVGYRRDPAECKPPDYKDCIVARRRWSFSKHRPLRMPITIDPKCADVPCDAFSTCRDGLCFSSEVDTDACDGDGCLEPGAIADGGTNVDAAVEPEGGMPDGGPDAPIDGPPVDGPNDGGLTDGDASLVPPYCTATDILHCWSQSGTDIACGSQLCCHIANAATCNTSGLTCEGSRRCCIDADCATYQYCSARAGAIAGTCVNKTDSGSSTDAGDGGQPPYCVTKMPAGEDLWCNLAGNVPGVCAPPTDCCDSDMAATCPPQGACTQARYCCTVDNCGNDGGWSCPRSQVEVQGGTPGRCVGLVGGGNEPYCETQAGPLHCGGNAGCNGPTFSCCAPNECVGAATGCGDDAGGAGKAQRCCTDVDCASNICMGKGVAIPGGYAPGFCKQL